MESKEGSRGGRSASDMAGSLLSCGTQVEQQGVSVSARSGCSWYTQARYYALPALDARSASR